MCLNRLRSSAPLPLYSIQREFTGYCNGGGQVYAYRTLCMNPPLEVIQVFEAFAQ